MQASERENARYAAGSINPVSLEENIMFSLLPEAGPGARLLDVGCGIGTISNILAGRGFQVSGVDFSAVAVEKAKANGVDASCVDVDAKGLPFPDSTFDVVWMGDVVEHVFDPLNLLAEGRRVLKPGGRLLMTVPNDMGIRARLKVALTGSSPHLRVYQKKRQNKHHSLISYDLMAFMLADAGFKIERFASIVKGRAVSSRLLGRLFGRVLIVSAAPVSR